MIKPWYIWLSIPAFVFLWFDSAGRLTNTKISEFLSDQGKVNLWISAIKNLIELVVFFIGIPAVAFVVLVQWLHGRDPYWAVSVQYAAYVAVYF